MKISKKTFDILKNFSGIRSSIYVDKGNVIRTVSTAKNIMAEAKVDESFPSPFAMSSCHSSLAIPLAMRTERWCAHALAERDAGRVHGSSWVPLHDSMASLCVGVS